MGEETAYGILQVQSAGGCDEHPITSTGLTFGRSSDNDIILTDDAQISRHHTRLQGTPQGWELTDLGTVNGTRRNGQPLPPRRPQPLRVGEPFQIGAFQFVVLAAAPAAPLPPRLGERLTVSCGPQAALVVYADGKVKKFVLPPDRREVSLGRGTDNDIVLPFQVVSGHHATLQAVAGGYRILDPGSTNGLVYNGLRIREKVLSDGDLLYITDKVVIQYRAHAGFVAVEAEEKVTPLPTQEVALPTDEEPVRIGRAADNQIVLDNPQVSRYHAVIERMGIGRYRIHDLRSTNGVYVNHRRIDRDAWLKEGDEIQIGPFRLDMQEGNIRRLAERGVRLDVVHLHKWVSKEKDLLQDISLSIYPQEFVALVGLSGAGKSTLMNAMSGFGPATHGGVFVNDVDLYRNFDQFRNEMGYVPQKDIVHAELSVHAALDYVAQLRMPADTTPAERHQRITEVLDDLDLTERKDLPIHKLSGGQLKRVSIGVELITKPRLFYLDEPTSGLDPGTEYNMMKLLRRLSDQGRTVVLITHATKNVMMCDKVIFLVRGGYVAFYGPPEDALAYFDKYRTDRERREKEMEFDSIYIVLEDEERGSPKQWAERYHASLEYQKYVADRLRNRKHQTAGGQEVSSASQINRQAGRSRRVNALQQLRILSARNINILMRDKLSLALMLLLAPAIGIMDFMWGRSLFDPVKGGPAKIITMLFMGALICILTGALSSVLQIVREADIYKRERIVGLQIGPYILSKMWIGFILALYQASVFLLFKVLLVNPQLPGAGAYVAMYITLFLGTLSGYLFGLAISAAAPNLNVALLLVIVVLVPQFLFAGALLPLDLIPGGEAISVIASTRWAFEAMVKLTGFGDRLVEDPCWGDRPKDDSGGTIGWNTLLNADDATKAAEKCVCMGSTIFTSCKDFPGILNSDYYTAAAIAALGRSEPVKPLTPTPYPTLTPYPSPTPYPTPSDPRKLSDYMESRADQGKDYQGLREEQGDEYQAMREEQGDRYADAMTAYGDDKAEWQRARERAIQGAEGLLKSVYENYARALKGTIVSRWLAMIAIMVVLLALIIFFQKRKDVV